MKNEGLKEYELVDMKKNLWREKYSGKIVTMDEIADEITKLLIKQQFLKGKLEVKK